VVTYERLLTEPKKLQAALWVLGSQGWEDLLVWFQAERQEHLEASVDSDDPVHQESHRTIAKWLKSFITQGTEDLRAMVETEPDASEEDQYMEFDSTGGQEPGPEGPNGSGPEDGSPRGIHQG
jgi:hypothetical protein